MLSGAKKLSGPKLPTRLRKELYNRANCCKPLYLNFLSLFQKALEHILVSTQHRHLYRQLTMPKEKNYNPVQAQRKADKAKAIKKGKWFNKL